MSRLEPPTSNDHGRRRGDGGRNAHDEPSNPRLLWLRAATHAAPWIAALACAVFGLVLWHVNARAAAARLAAGAAGLVGDGAADRVASGLAQLHLATLAVLIAVVASVAVGGASHVTQRLREGQGMGACVCVERVLSARAAQPGYAAASCLGAVQPPSASTAESHTAHATTNSLKSDGRRPSPPTSARAVRAAAALAFASAAVAWSLCLAATALLCLHGTLLAGSYAVRALPLEGLAAAAGDAVDSAAGLIAGLVGEGRAALAAAPPQVVDTDW
jgi:hypothetical protein